MFTHSKLWSAIDQLARSNGYSASGLAKKAGLDPTSFNKSKRKSKEGKARWPSTESISKVLNATGSNMSEFIALMGEKPIATTPSVDLEAEPVSIPEPIVIEKEIEVIREVEVVKEVVVEKEVFIEVEKETVNDAVINRNLPLLPDDIAVNPASFDTGGFPANVSAASFTMPDGQPQLSDKAWALEITGGAFAPYYQEGDILLVDPDGPARAGDPFLIRRRSENKLAVYRGQSANPAIGDPLGRIMGVFYGMTNQSEGEEIAA